MFNRVNVKKNSMKDSKRGIDILLLYVFYPYIFIWCTEKSTSSKTTGCIACEMF